MMVHHFFFSLIWFNYLAVMLFTLFGQAEYQDSPIHGLNLFLTKFSWQNF